MLGHFKELIVVLGLALMVFALGAPVALRFMRAEDFRLRRNVWFVLTIAAFLSPNFWIYAFVAVIALAWAARRDANPAALYVLAFAIVPPMRIYIPVVGINQLFPMSQGRLLSLVVLLPIAFRLFTASPKSVDRRWTWFDAALIAYCLLQIVLIVPYEAFTNTLRRAFLLSTDLLLVYYVFSRIGLNRQVLRDLLATFVMVGALLAAIATFETFKGWLLYEQIAPGWGSPNFDPFLMRGDSLRAQASTGHSLALGYLLAMALGAWFYLRRYLTTAGPRWLTTALLCLGLFASHSRGPWLAALIVYFSYLALAPHGMSGLLKGTVVVATLAALLSVTPIGQRMIDLLPFVGTAEQSNIEYRQRLAEESWRLIQIHPYFGDPFVLARMEDLRQGQGIIDLVNAYAIVALYYGLVGLALFAALFLGATLKTLTTLRRLRDADPDLAALGAALAACMIGSLFFMATAGIDWFEYALVGMLCGYLGIVRANRPAPQTDPSVAPEPLEPVRTSGFVNRPPQPPSHPARAPMAAPVQPEPNPSA